MSTNVDAPSDTRAPRLSLVGFSRACSVNPSSPMSWLPESGALCTVDSVDALTDTVDEWTGEQADGSACGGCPFTRECAGSAVLQGAWLHVRGGMTGPERATWAVAEGLDPSLVPGWAVDEAAADGRHGVLTTAATCKCAECRVVARAEKQQRERELDYEQSADALARRRKVKADYTRNRYAAARAAGLTRQEIRTPKGRTA